MTPRQISDWENRDRKTRELTCSASGCEIQEIGLRNRTQSYCRRAAFEADPGRRQPGVPKGCVKFLLGSEGRFRQGPSLIDKVTQLDLRPLGQAMMRCG